jgi:hypothetical protein
LVDSGSYYLYINEVIQEQLQFPYFEKRKVQLANGSIEEYDAVGHVDLKFKNRRCNVDAMILKGNNEALLSAIPREDMDVLIHPLTQISEMGFTCRIKMLNETWTR